MTNNIKTVGHVTGLWCYPVKSLAGIERQSVTLTQRGVVGDRAWALLDDEVGMVVSAKDVRRWPNVLDCKVALLNEPSSESPIPPVRITLPDGSVIESEQADKDRLLSDVFGRHVKLSCTPPEQPVLQQYHLDEDRFTRDAIPGSAFFDCATLHVLTTATLRQLKALYPEGIFDIRRFRPNVLVSPSSEEAGFVENDWVGRTLQIGENVRLAVSEPCPRCVMTTVQQGDLQIDPMILRTIAKHNQGNVGVYLKIIQEGTIKTNDAVQLAD